MLRSGFHREEISAVHKGGVRQLGVTLQECAMTETFAFKIEVGGNDYEVTNHACGLL